MKSELWQRVETLFFQALEIDDDQREAWLQAAARGDPELLREVRDLLSSYRAPGSFMEDLVFAQGLQVLGIDDQEMPFGKFGRYEIVKRIGIGGMGEVFLAHDPTLDRQVALKLLPTLVTDDPQRVRRFQQEAHAASTISHPNVAHIYEIGVEGNRYFTSMEYVEGRTLREVLNQGPLTVPEALKIALEVGRALESAHASGVIHRDIKPENIMIRPDGYVKVLDFGLAKLHRIADPQDVHSTQTTTLVLTEPGLIMGSPAYMSPEQARGFDVDARSDIWSLGIVLYEMLCGATPFPASTKMDVFAALLRDEPTPISLSLRHTHPGVRKLLKRMLAKDKDQRYPTSAEVVADLQNLIRNMRVSVKRKSQFQGSRLAFLKYKALEAFRSSEGTIIRTPLPFFIATIIAGIALTWTIKSFQPRHVPIPISDPESEKHYQRGVEAIFRDDCHFAAYHLDELLIRGGIHARSIMARARLAEVWAELDYWTEAESELGALVNLVRLYEESYNFPEIDSLYVNATKATVRRDFHQATTVYREIVEKDPTNAIAWMDLGRSYERLRWWDQAADSYRQACAKDPSLASAFLRLGIIEAARKNEPEANTAFDRALQLYRTANDKAGVWELLNHRRFLAYQLGRKDEAQRFEEEAGRIGYRNDYQSVKHNFALARIFHKDTQLAKAFESEARKHADSLSGSFLFRRASLSLVNGLVEIAELYMRENDLISAQEYLLEALRIAQGSGLRIGRAKVLYARAQLYLREGRPIDADREFKEMLRFEFPIGEFSDQLIALWRNTIFDVDYETAINRLSEPPPAGMVPMIFSCNDTGVIAFASTSNMPRVYVRESEVVGCWLAESDTKWKIFIEPTNGRQRR